MTNVLVSIIMPNYNGERFLAQSIQSVQRQTFKDWELLIIDDGSKDSSIEIAEKFGAEDTRVRVLRTKFKKLAHGPGAARNTGIEAARGRYIAFLDSDDLWLPSKLEEQIKFMQANGLPFTYCWYDVVNERGEKVGQRSPSAPSRTYRQLLKECVIGCLTVVYDTQIVGKQLINLHPDDRFADYSLWLKILKITPKATLLPKVLAEYRLVTGSISANKLDAAKHNWRILRRVERLSLPRAAYYFTWYAVKGVLTKLTYILSRKIQGSEAVKVES